MLSGSVQNVVLCIPKTPNTGNSQAPCATVGAQRYVPHVQTAYLLDPSIEPTITAIQNANNGSINYHASATAFGASFILVLTLYVMAKPVGTMLRLLKR